MTMTCDFLNNLLDEYPEILNVSGGESIYDLSIVNEHQGEHRYHTADMLLLHFPLEHLTQPSSHKLHGWLLLDVALLCALCRECL